MRIEKAKVGEVILNKVNNQRYIVTEVTEPIDDITVATAQIYNPDLKEISQDVPEQVEITSANARIYKHLFNTIKENAVNDANITEGKFYLNDVDVPTGEIVPVKVLGVTDNFVVFEGRRGNDSFAYIYDAKRDHFKTLFKAENIESLEAKNIILLTDKRAEDVLDETTGEITGQKYYARVSLVTENEAYEEGYYHFRAQKIALDDKTSKVTTKLLRDGKYAIISAETTGENVIFICEDSRWIYTGYSRDYIPTNVCKWQDSLSFITPDHFIYGFMGEERKIAVDTSLLKDCKNLFEVSRNGDTTEYSFTDDEMKQVVTITVTSTNDRGDIVTISKA